MNALQSILHTRTPPRIAGTRGVTPLRVAQDILRSEAVAHPRIVTVEQIGALFGTGQHLSRHPDFQVVRMTELQLRMMAKYIVIFPRFAPLAYMLRHPSTEYIVRVEKELLARAERPAEHERASVGYRVALREMSDAERGAALDAARVAGLRSVELSLATLVTTSVLSQLLLRRPIRGTYRTRTMLRSGTHYTVGPDEEGRIAVCAAPMAIYPAALGLVIDE